jgi:hypothetical protein
VGHGGFSFPCPGCRMADATRKRLLEKFKFFNSFYHLSEQRSREDITRMAIECFDYSL